MATRLRACGHNALSLVQPGRMQEVADALNSTLSFCIGTRVRAVHRDSSHHIQKLHDRRWAIHFGWDCGPLTNRCCGLSIIMDYRFRPKCAKEILAPPRELKGRGGGLHLKAGSTDILSIAGDVSPHPVTTRKRDTFHKMLRQLAAWLDRCLCNAASRKTPICFVSLT